MPFLRSSCSSSAIEEVLDDFIPGLDQIRRIWRHKVKQLGMGIESKFTILAGFAIDFFSFLRTVFPVLQVSQGIIDPKIWVLLKLANEPSLQFSKQFEVIEYLRVSRISNILLILEEDPEGVPLLLAFGFDSVPVGQDLLGLPHWGLH